jgi:hypothetical protein
MLLCYVAWEKGMASRAVALGEIVSVAYLSFFNGANPKPGLSVNGDTVASLLIELQQLCLPAASTAPPSSSALPLVPFLSPPKYPDTISPPHPDGS